MKYSKFGQKFACEAGILSLMKDMGEALSTGGDDLMMMGGGNPGFVPAFQEMMQHRLQVIAGDSNLCRRLMGVYCSPQGELDFIASLAKMLRNQHDWNISEKNICLTNGSQSGFFLLLNMFGGEFDGGVHKKIRLPLTPEYIGYADIGITNDFFISSRPKIELLDNDYFKYRVDFDELNVGDETGAICVSRPTNPTGNVITDSEVEKLDLMAREANVPLIIDNAYGLPFPGIVYVDATPMWNENIIMCLSLSKLGLPAVRTGIIIANEDVVNRISGMNAIMALSPTGFGAVLAHDMVATGEITSVSQTVIRPFYEDKARKAVQKIQSVMGEAPCKIHKPEGAMFLWLWFEDLPISCRELYERLKNRGVLIISGHYFFPGLEDDEWKHKHECIRVTYSQDERMVERGIEIIGEEVKKAYGQY